MPSSKVSPVNEGGPRVGLRPVTECGIRVSWLVLWAKRIQLQLGPAATTGEVCEKHVIPTTSSRNCRYVDIIQPADVGSPTYFLSHTWSWNFQTMVEVVTKRLHDEQDAFVWLDICAINQNKYKDKGELQQNDVSHLADVVRKAKSTLFCLDEKGKTLTRIWCLWEIWQTVDSKGAAGLQILTYKNPDLEGLFNVFDVSKAEASLESDRKRILAEIAADIGYVQLSLTVKEALVDSAEREAQQALALAKQHVGSRNSSQVPLDLALAAAEACNKAANIAQAAGKSMKAGKVAASSLDLTRSILGPEHSATLLSMTYLASSLSDQGRFREAAYMQRQVYDLQIEARGPEHLDTLTAMNHLASTLATMGQLKEAATIQRQVYESRKKVLGPRHLSTLNSMQNLAYTLSFNQGKHEEALPLQRQVLEQKTQVLGPEHPSTLTIMAHVAFTLQKLGRQEEGEALDLKVYDLRKKVLGPEHPDTLEYEHNRAVRLRKLGKYGEADTIQQQVSCRKVFLCCAPYFSVPHWLVKSIKIPVDLVASSVATSSDRKIILCTCVAGFKPAYMITFVCVLTPLCAEVD